MIINLITPTGGRPEAFKLCESYIKSQTYKGPYQWCVIDDFTPYTKCTMGQTYIRGPRAWEPEINTQRYNLDAALEHMKGDFIFFIEDDEYYHPTYIERMLEMLRHVQIVGLGNSKYYYVPAGGYKVMNNYQHAALSQTAIRKELLPMYKAALHSGQLFFDIILWQKCIEKRLPMAVLSNTNLSIGMKGMPGRMGIGSSHREKKDYLLDPGHGKLKEWLGEAHKNYLPYFKGVKNAIDQKRPQSSVQHDQTVRR